MMLYYQITFLFFR